MKRIMIVACMAALTGCTMFGPDYTVRMETERVTIGRSVPNLKGVIAQSALGRGWKVTKEERGSMTLTLSPRQGKHEVVIAVDYTDKDFAVRYVSSENMDYDPTTGEISRKYIQWVRNLKNDIYRNAFK